MDVEYLIDCVRKYEFIYDVTHIEYKNPCLKATVWDTIGQDLNESGETCKLKWKTVRDGYMKYKKQLKSAKSTGKIINYIWSNKLKFLDNYHMNRLSAEKDFTKTCRYCKPNQICTRNLSHSNHKQSDDSQTQEASPYIADSPPPVVPSDSTNSPEANSVANSDQNSQCKLHDQEALKNYDGTDYLFLSYSQTFKKFSLKQQVMLKVELAKLFANAELKECVSAECLEVDNFTDVVIKSEYPENCVSESALIDVNDAREAIQGVTRKRAKYV